MSIPIGAESLIISSEILTHENQIIISVAHENLWKKQISAIVIAGVIAESIFDLYAWLISPALFGLALQPSNLVIAIAKITVKADLPHSLAFIIHALIGSIGFATAVYIVKQVSKFSFLTAGALTGFLLWFIAQGILAPFIGRPFMMEFGAYTQSSFVGHDDTGSYDHAKSAARRRQSRACESLNV